MPLQIKWTNIKSNSGAKCRYQGPRYQHHKINKGDKALLLGADSSGGNFEIYLCEEHAINFLKNASNILKEYYNNPKAPWNKKENGEGPGDICCSRSGGNKCYEHDPDNYLNGHLV